MENLRNRIEENKRMEREYEYDVRYAEWRLGKPDGFINEDQIRSGFYRDVYPERLVENEINRRKKRDQEY